MKHTIICLLTFFIGIGSHFAHAHDGKKGVNWLTDYDEAIKSSKNSSKPIVLFFTGSDWCSWCTKLEQEALDTPEFAETVGDKFIFVKLDFPLNTPLPPKITAQNKDLQKKHDVRGFPTIIILDPKDQRRIGLTGYRPGGGKAYATHLLNIINDYSSYQNKMAYLGKENISGNDLKTLYEKACEIELKEDAEKIVSLGMKSELCQFFQVEHYRCLADAGKIHSEEAAALKQLLIKSDPTNAKQTHYQVAVIDFEASCDKMEKENYSPEVAVLPLINYIDTFGNNDKENLWRLQMIISQVFFDKNKLPEALKYAQSSYKTAPATAQPDIAIAIKNIQSQIEN